MTTPGAAIETPASTVVDSRPSALTHHDVLTRIVHFVDHPTLSSLASVNIVFAEMSLPRLYGTVCLDPDRLARHPASGGQHDEAFHSTPDILYRQTQPAKIKAHSLVRQNVKRLNLSSHIACCIDLDQLETAPFPHLENLTLEVTSKYDYNFPFRNFLDHTPHYDFCRFRESCGSLEHLRPRTLRVEGVSGFSEYPITGTRHLQHLKSITIIEIVLTANPLICGDSLFADGLPKMSTESIKHLSNIKFLSPPNLERYVVIFPPDHTYHSPQGGCDWCCMMGVQLYSLQTISQIPVEIVLLEDGATRGEAGVHDDAGAQCGRAVKAGMRAASACEQGVGRDWWVKWADMLVTCRTQDAPL